MPMSRRMMKGLLAGGMAMAVFASPLALFLDTDAPPDPPASPAGPTGTPRPSASGPRLDPFAQRDGPFALTRRDVERASWSWSRAKTLAAGIHEDQLPARNRVSSFYCGCQIERRGRSGGDVVFSSCDFETSDNPTRARRLEWEHVVPAAFIGRGRSCWTDGHESCIDDGVPFKGRKCCMMSDPGFIMAASDPVNLVPSVGEINGDRSNYLFGLINGEKRDYGQCDFEVDTRNRIAEPAPSKRGDIGRIWAYMSRAYGLALPRDKANLYTRWIKQDPVSQEEIVINEAISRSGHRANPFVLTPRTNSENREEP